MKPAPRLFLQLQLILCQSLSFSYFWDSRSDSSQLHLEDFEHMKVIWRDLETSFRDLGHMLECVEEMTRRNHVEALQQWKCMWRGLIRELDPEVMFIDLYSDVRCSRDCWDRRHPGVCAFVASAPRVDGQDLLLVNFYSLIRISLALPLPIVIPIFLLDDRMNPNVVACKIDTEFIRASPRVVGSMQSWRD